MKNLVVFLLAIILLSGCDFLFPNKGKDEIFITEAIIDSGATVTPLKVMTQKGENAFFSYSLKNGYELVSIIADGVSITPTSNSFTRTDINSDGKVYINTRQKEKQKFVISINYGPGGKVDPSGDVIVTEGQNQTVDITPNPGFLQDMLKIDGATVSTTSSHTFNNVSSDRKLDATFKKDSLLWPILFIEWKQDSVYIDQYKWPETIPVTLNYSSDGTFTRLRKGILSTEKWIIDRSKKPATITYGGALYSIEEINEERYVISNVNGAGQYVRLIFKNNRYK